jgi:hypothetical protein
MAKRTGKDLNLLVGGTAISVPTGWSYEETDSTAETTAAGDAWIDRASLRGDYTVEWNARVEIASPYVLPTAVRGTLVTWALEVIAADAQGIVVGTGLCTMFRLEAAYDQPLATSGRIQSAGTGPTFDLQPAT